MRTKQLGHRKMKTNTAVLGILLISAVSLAAAESDRFVQKMKLASGQTAVVAEGDFEPRSTGSFSVRLYSGENPHFHTDDFLGGVIHQRDGSVEKVVLADVDGDGLEEIVVIVRSIGTGSYLSVHAFAIDKKRLVLQASVADLARDADPVSTLKKTKGKSR